MKRIAAKVNPTAPWMGRKKLRKRTRSLNWLDLLKAVAMPLVVAMLGYWLNASLNEWQQRAADNRMYIQTMGRREDAENSLRKDMFKYILDTFMSGPPGTKPGDHLDQEILSLELLATTFMSHWISGGGSSTCDRGFRQARTRPPAAAGWREW